MNKTLLSKRDAKTISILDKSPHKTSVFKFSEINGKVKAVVIGI